jgi:phosphoribosyl-ATP pyrophosphohydrolase/phosphoribosyl-AMP cyclohydrolase
MPDEPGLFTVVAQDADTGDVLMVAYGNAESFRRTQETGLMHYWSRSRERLWRKGEESGNIQEVVSLTWDCDRDTLLARVRPRGPACHTGSRTCFGEPPGPRRIVAELWRLFQERERSPPQGSYVAKLLADPAESRRKVEEEALEFIEATERGRREDVIHEAADLTFHALVLLFAAGVSADEVLKELEARRR